MIKYITGIYALISMVVGNSSPLIESPPTLRGEFSLTSYNMHTITMGEYLYNAVDDRIRMMGYFDSLKLHRVPPTIPDFDVLLHYNEHIVYVINEQNHTCVKHPLKGNFHPLKIPQNATLGSSHTIGLSLASDPREGLYVNCWTGKLPEEKAKYASKFTASGSIPVSNVYYTELRGVISMGFINNFVEENLPAHVFARTFDAPSYCQDPDQQTPQEQEPADFYSLLLKPQVESN